MEHRHAIAVDETGNKLEFVLVRIEEMDGTRQEVPLYYQMPENATLVYDDVEAALGMLKPKWQEGKWREVATEEELVAARPIAEGQPQASTLDLLAAELAKMVAAVQLQTDMAMAELAMAVNGR